MKTATFKSFKSLANAINGSKNPDKWLEFLKEKGHTMITFSYLPEDIKTSLKFSFAKKNN